MRMTSSSVGCVSANLIKVKVEPFPILSIEDRAQPSESKGFVQRGSPGSTVRSIRWASAAVVAGNLAQWLLKQDPGQFHPEEHRI
jgi:hypothetical protein